jgi:hypothetical protein
MNPIKRIWFQLTTARKGCVKPIQRSVQDMIQDHSAAEYLLKIGLISRCNLTVEDHLKQQGFVLEARTFQFARVAIDKELENKIPIISEESCRNLNFLLQKFGADGITAWLIKARPDQFKVLADSFEFYHDAKEYLDEHSDIIPQITFLDDLITTYRTFKFVDGDRTIIRHEEVESTSEKESSFTGVIDQAEQIDALFWLIARDIVFLSTYDPRVKEYTGGYTMVLNVNDAFYYATADAEEFPQEDAPVLKKLFEKYGYSGIQAYVAIKRKQDVLPELRSEKYHQAWAEIMADAFCTLPKENINGNGA